MSDSSIVLLQQGRRLFPQVFNQVPEQVFFSPGRVNLIGEHLDYNGGLVLPCAIELGVLALLRYRGDRLTRCFSQQYGEQGVLCSSLEQLAEVTDWRRVLGGCLQQFSQWGCPFERGFDLLLLGNLPLASGLSSSAAVLVLLLKALAHQQQFELDGVKLALAAQRVEHEFLGTPCGIMDQFAVVHGREGQAMLLDCASLECRYLPLFSAGDAWRLLVANTNKPRRLVDSPYRQRREQCQQALAQLNQHQVSPAETLCQLSEEVLLGMEEGVLRRRARHVISEQQRTQQAAAALEQGRWADLGPLLNASHFSLRDDYEVSCAELNLLVQWLQSQPQVAGARMTGAGFGGCALALLAGELDCQPLAQLYQKQFGYRPDFYTCRPAAGVRLLSGV